jgi:hypothetical protein
MSKEFDCEWEDITNLNIVTFNHKLKFVEHLFRERNKNAKKR